MIALRADEGALHMVTAAEYDDELRRTDGGWRIAERKVLAWLPRELSDARLATAE